MLLCPYFDRMKGHKNMQVMLEEPKTEQKKFVKVGFSWTLFLLTIFYGIPLFLRGLIGHGIAVLLVAMIGAIAQSNGDGGGLVELCGLILIGFAVFYGIKGNELTAKRLIKKGWKFSKEDSATEYARAKWSMPA